MKNIKISYLMHSIVKGITDCNISFVNNYVDKMTGLGNETWGRVVMSRDCCRLINELTPNKLKVLEISGHNYNKFEFAEYKSVTFPEFDICSNILDEQFDLIIAEQVFEHLLWPYRAAKNVHRMLKQSGSFLVSIPFMVRLHDAPSDCTRWSETGLRYFLAECGFPLDGIYTSSWGNEACIKANFKEWVRYRPMIHSLQNQPEIPYHVWGLAKK